MPSWSTKASKLTNLLAAGEKNAYSVVRIALFRSELNLDHKIMLKYLLAIYGNGFSRIRRCSNRLLMSYPNF